MKKSVTSAFLTLVIITAVLLSVIPSGKAVSWSSPGKQITNSTSSDYSPTFCQTSDGKIWLLWVRSPPTQPQYILYKTYNGTWSNEKTLVQSSGDDDYPSIIQTSDRKIWLFWASDRGRSIGNYTIFYKTSSNNGESWSSEIQLTNTSCKDVDPAVMQTMDNRIWVFWHRFQAGNNYLYYKIYDQGSWWGESQMTSDITSDKQPSLLQHRNGTIWLFWTSVRTGSPNIFYRTSNDNGDSWSSDKSITPAAEWDELSSATQAIDGKIWIAWQRLKGDGSNMWYDLYYKIYDGASWLPENVLESDGSANMQPAIYQAANKTMWVAWSSDRGGSENNLFYKVTLPYQHDVGISKVTVTRDIVFRGFETTLKINASIWNFGLNTENFQVIAYYNSAIIGSYTFSLYPNSNVIKQFTLNTLSLSLGYYVIKVQASTVYGETDTADNIYEYGMITLTYPGDANADRIVDIADVAEVNYHWYDPPFYYSLKYDEKADFNSDGRINIYDSSLINLYSYKSW